MEKIIKIEMKLSGTEKEIERLKARAATLSIFEIVKSFYIKEI